MNTCQSDLYLWNIEGCNTKLYLTILWWFIFLVFFIHKYTHHIKYKIQYYRNLEDQLCKSFFHSTILKDPSPFPWTMLLTTLLSMTLLHTCSYFICEWLFLKYRWSLFENFLCLIYYVFLDNVFFRMGSTVTFIKILWVIKWVFTNSFSYFGLHSLD